MRKSARVFIPSTAFKYTPPPSPPSPPSGPPKGTNFSRRKLTQPRPPLPACTLSLASSTNFMVDGLRKLKRGTGVGLTPLSVQPASASGPQRRLLRNDVDVGVLFRALDAKFHRTVCLGEQGVIGADSYIDAGAIHR